MEITKEKLKEEFLSEVYINLEAFYSFTHLGSDIINGRVSEDVEGYIISQDEKDAVIKVLDVLKDCGAKIHGLDVRTL